MDLSLRSCGKSETGAETFGSTRVGRATYNYGSGQGYNVTGTVGVGIKF